MRTSPGVVGVLWTDELQSLDQPPFRMDEGSLYICYNAAAEFSAHHSLGWDLPIHCLDLHAEERVLQNGKISGPGTFKLHLH